jgi:hypothetical protein
MAPGSRGTPPIAQFADARPQASPADSLSDSDGKYRHLPAHTRKTLTQLDREIQDLQRSIQGQAHNHF